MLEGLLSCRQEGSSHRPEWSGRPDSNRGPLPPHGSALTILRHAPTFYTSIPEERYECKG